MNKENDEKMKKVFIDMATKSEAIENLLVDYNSDNKRIIDKAKMEHLEDSVRTLVDEFAIETIAIEVVDTGGNHLMMCNSIHLSDATIHSILNDVEIALKNIEVQS